jgi:cbb3-type cytochrome oxidase subunit 3
MMMIAFFGIIFWAYSDKQKANFEHMSSLPLDENFESTEIKGEENGND